MEHQRAMELRQRIEAEARRRLDMQGFKDPRTGGICDFDEMRQYDIKLQDVIWQLCNGVRD